jgi:hypothetical protein
MYSYKHNAGSTFSQQTVGSVCIAGKCLEEGVIASTQFPHYEFTNMQFVCKFYTFWRRKNISNDVLDDELQTDLCPFMSNDTCEKRARFGMK